MSRRRDRTREREAAIENGRQSFAAAVDDVFEQMHRRLGVAGKRHWVLPIVAAAAGVGLALLLKRRLAAPGSEHGSSSFRSLGP